MRMHTQPQCLPSLNFQLPKSKCRTPPSAESGPRTGTRSHNRGARPKTASKQRKCIEKALHPLLTEPRAKSRARVKSAPSFGNPTVAPIDEGDEAVNARPQAVSNNTRKRKGESPDVVGNTKLCLPTPLLPNNPPLVTYAALDEDNDIRLISLLPGEASDEIRCRLECVGLTKEHKPRYKALSYAWGAPGGTRVVDLGGIAFPVTENLWQALHQLRSRDHELSLWVDALCINQSHVHERNAQVQKMGTIYRRAEEVIVWLGVQGDNSATAFAFMRKILDPHHVVGQLLLMCREADEGWVAIIKLFNREYWNRVWIIQEVLRATKLTVHCGRDRMPWAVFAKFCRKCDTDWSQSILQYLSMGGWRSEFLQSPAAIIDEQRSTRATGRFLLSLLEDTQTSHSTEPRDRVFALLGLAKDRFLLQSSKTQLQIDYVMSPFELYDQIIRLYPLTQRVRLAELLHCVLGKGQRQPAFRHEDFNESPIDALGYLSATLDNVSPPWKSEKLYSGADTALDSWIDICWNHLPVEWRGIWTLLERVRRDPCVRRLGPGDFMMSSKEDAEFVQQIRDYETQTTFLAVRETVSLKSSTPPYSLRYFRTTNGYVGLVHSSFEASDELYLFEDSTIALVLAKQPSSDGNLRVGRALVMKPCEFVPYETSHGKALLERWLFRPTKEELVVKGEELYFKELGFRLRTSSWEMLTY